MSRSKSILAAIFYGPIFWGCLVSIGFYAAIHQKHISNPMIQRYFAGKSVEYVTTVLFFVALAAIVIKLIELVLEPRVGTDLWLDPIPDEKQPPGDAGSLLAQMASWPTKLRHSLLGRRLHDALESVQRHNSAEKLDDELHAMADTAAGEAHAKMALVRTIISCIPVLGFLGTVIGITEAVAHLSAVIKNVAFDKAVEVLGAKLGEGFDATALALALSMVLMFMLFFVNYLETRLLGSVEIQANRELVGRFQTAAEDHDPNVAVVRRMADEVIESTERLVARQAELWTETVGAAQKRWAGQAVSTERQLETALGNALRSSLETHAQHLHKSEESMAEAGR
ncbi:MAG: MotA/TolQ/ExbB proton channel family protein, partial [Planctomycetia bacterium]|nr:MotA/TolQ/ExbB proton channel family protein [Planctomycetia bacterium]